MSWRTYAAVVVGLSALAVLDATSAPRDPVTTRADQYQGGRTEQRPNTANGGDSPDGAATIPANTNRASSDGEATPDADKGRDGSSADWALVRLTLALVAVGVLQFLTYLGQAFLMWRTLRVSNRNAEEANLAGQRLVRLEQPWLTPLPALPKPVSDREIAYQFRFKIVNYGRTPAWVTFRRSDIVRVVDREVPAKQPPGFLATAISANEIAIAPRKKFVDYVIEELDETDKAEMMRGRLTFLLHGEVEYRDIFNAVHRAGFAWFVVRWHPGLKREAPWDEWLWGFQRGPDEYWTSD